MSEFRRAGKPIIGLCGGIGAGKSETARAFERLGARVISSDDLNQMLLDRPDVQAELRLRFGEEVVGPDGRTDRRALSRRVLRDPVRRRELESLMHPLIARERADMIDIAVNDPAIRAIILDSPLLFESNLDAQCDAVVFVEADEERRITRVQRDRNWTREEFQTRQSLQAPLEEKRARADFVIRNEGTLEGLQAQVERVFRGILGRRE